MRRPVPLLLSIVAAAALTACGNVDAGSGSPSTARNHDPAGAAVEVIVGNRGYLPAEVAITAGETVAWSFEDRARHDVAFDDGPASPIQRDGAWSRTFEQPGTYRYVCTLHPDMTGTVVVEP